MKEDEAKEVRILARNRLVLFELKRRLVQHANVENSSREEVDIPSACRSVEDLGGKELRKSGRLTSNHLATEGQGFDEAAAEGEDGTHASSDRSE